jgi:cytochrome c5
VKTFLKATAFSLLAIAGFTAFSYFGIPQIEPAPPPKEEVLDLGAMSMGDFVALGERLFEGKGTCTLCHNPVGARAPLLDTIAQVAEQRIADPGYGGQATDFESYIYESMVEPSAYVVPGFGKTGSNDTESPMPDASAGSVSLSEAELRAVIAFLQDSSGLEVTVEIPSDVDAVEQQEVAAAEGPRPPFTTPEEAVAEFACGACHVIAGEEGDVGPNLTGIGALRDKDYLRRAILEPNAEIPEGFEPDLMPPDYGEQLYAQELEMLVNYMAGLK